MRTAMARTIESLWPGEVASYGEVARRSGYPNRHRVVGQLLSVSLDALPWWRVVYADGRLPPVNPTLQERKLTEEGVRVEGFRVRQATRGEFATDLAGEGDSSSEDVIFGDDDLSGIGDQPSD